VHQLAFLGDGFCVFQVCGHDLEARCANRFSMGVNYKNLPSRARDFAERALLRVACNEGGEAWLEADDALFAHPEVARGSVREDGTVAPAPHYEMMRQEDELQARWRAFLELGVKPNGSYSAETLPDVIAWADHRVVVVEEQLGQSDCSGEPDFVRYYRSRLIHRSQELRTDSMLVGDFPEQHLGIKPGISADRVRELLGTPYRAGGGVLTYAELDLIAREFDQKHAFAETLRLFFENDRLVSIWVHKEMVC
jgi:hypothetical protein